MVTDSRGHEVPAGSDSWGYREDMGLLSASISDVRQVADTAAATSAVADLDAAGITSVGTVWWLDSPGGLYVYDGTQLQTMASLAQVPVVAYGATTLSGTADKARTKTITLPAGRFPAMPVVMLQNLTGYSPSSANQVEWPTDRTASSFQANLTRSNATTVSLLWFAIYSPTGAGFLAERTTRTAERPSATATCPTDGCPNQGIAIEVTATRPDDETGERVPVDAIECGVCGTDITATAREAS